MKQSLRKGSSGISITYSNHNYTNNLVGSNFTAEILGEDISFGIDLSSNLKVRNKSANCYHDALELIEDSSQFKTIQITEDQVINGLADVSHKAPDAFWQLKLTVGNNILRYEVTPSQSEYGVFFSVS